MLSGCKSRMIIWWSVNPSYLRVRTDGAKALLAFVLTNQHILQGMIAFILGICAIIFLAAVGNNQLSQAANDAKREITIHSSQQSYDDWIQSEIINRFNGSSIKKYLEELTETPHVAGTPENLVVANKIRQTWLDQGLINVHFAEYEKVLLSYPNYHKPNRAVIRDAHGSIHFWSSGVSKVIIPSEQSYPGAGVRFNAYSASGTVTGNAVYCNYGREEDFDHFKQVGVSVQGRIAIIRYGMIWRGEKAYQAQKNGAIGVILYSDPADYAKEGIDQLDVFPNKVWMPPSGAQRGSLLQTDGDPQTPLYPAKNYTYRSMDPKELRQQQIIPSIPVLPMSYGDAYHFLKILGGRRAPSSWQGGLNFTYRLGPTFVNNGSITISVHSKLAERKIQNVIAVIPGSIEPDRYVLIGNHYDAWVNGAVDPNSGTAVLLEMSRIFMDLINEEVWRPARSLVFCAWDAEEYGLIGSTEWIEEHLTMLRSRAVAYLNVDLMPGNFTLTVQAVPSLFQLVASTATKIPNPNKAEEAKGRKSVYDTWNASYPGKYPWNIDYPDILSPKGGSDHKNFLHMAGVPVINFRYVNHTSTSYPLYHTMYETMYLLDKLMDHANFSVHVAFGQYWALLTASLAASDLLPMNLHDYAKFIEFELQKLQVEMKTQHKATFPEKLKIQWSYIQESVSRLETATYEFYVKPLVTGMMNERMAGFERCFINPRGITETQPIRRHLIFGTDLSNSYASQVFPGIRYGWGKFIAAKNVTEHAAVQELCEQISHVQYAIECAIKLLRVFI